MKETQYTYLALREQLVMSVEHGGGVLPDTFLGNNLMERFHITTVLIFAIAITL